MTIPETIGVLTGLDTKEVSLVDKPANMRPFLALKNKGEDMDEAIENVLTVEADGEDVVEKSKGISEKGKPALVSAFRILKHFEDEYSKEALLEVLKAAGVEIPKPQQAAETQEQEQPVSTAELPEEVQALFKSQQEAIAKRDARLEEVEKKLAKAEEDRLVAEFTKKAETEYSQLGDPKEVGSILKALDGHQVEASLEKILKAANEAIAKGGLFGEIGTPAEPPNAGGVQDAHSELTKIAKELMAAGTVTNEADGLILAMKRHPDLVEKSRQ